MPGLFVGLMSGTSMDGIDAVLVAFEPGRHRLLAAVSEPWPPTLRERLQTAARGGFLSAAQFAELHAEAGEAFARAALQVIDGHQASDIRAIGSHGQTLAHAPTARLPHSLQIGCGARISELTGITTVTDFRSRDMAAGGQGAPLVPAFHRAALHSAEEDRVVLNIGGIANITVLPAGVREPVSGFDTGPGNCLMDAWTQQQLGQPFDRNGRLAASGSVDRELLQSLLADPYFALAAPKSTGTDYFSTQWLQQRLALAADNPADVQATLLALTSNSISTAIKALPHQAARVLVCGGGASNPVLMQDLRSGLGCPVESTATYGVDPDWMEAIAFAWLAQQTLAGLPGNLPSVTGAAGLRVLGAVYPA